MVDTKFTPGNKTVELTERQAWFINCAIELKDAVLPLDEETLSEEEFLESYGVSKERVNLEITLLRLKLKFATDNTVK